MPPLPTAPEPVTDAVRRAGYAEGAGIYRIRPEAVVQPDADTLGSTLTLAGPVVVRGAGSGMSGGNVGPGRLLDLTGLAGCRIRPSDGQAEAGAGVVCRTLNREAGRHGLRLPPEPSSARFATLGGMAACNAAGARSFGHGPIRDWVLGLTLLTSEGERLRLEAGRPAPERSRLAERLRPVEQALLHHADLILDRFPRTRKNAAGYALDVWLETRSPLDLVIGSEGTLGVITELTLRLEPVPEYTGGLRAAVPDDATLTAALEILRESGASAIEFLDHTFLRFVAGTVPEADRHDAAAAHALLLVEYEGSADQVTRRMDRAGKSLESVATGVRAVVVPTPGVDEERPELHELWEIRHAASPILARLTDGRRSLQVIEDGCVPPERLAEYLRGIRQVCREEEVEAVLFGHAGDAHVHVNLLPDLNRAGWEDRLRRVFGRATGLQLGLGGTTSGEHGVGRLRSATLERQYGPEIVGLMRAVKEAFDPRGIMNPGVLFPEPGWDPISHLKVGAGAEPIPEPVAMALREIEMTGGYARNRMELAGTVAGTRLSP